MCKGNLTLFINFNNIDYFNILLNFCNEKPCGIN